MSLAMQIMKAEQTGHPHRIIGSPRHHCNESRSLELIYVKTMKVSSDFDAAHDFALKGITQEMYETLGSDLTILHASRQTGTRGFYQEGGVVLQPGAPARWDLEDFLKAMRVLIGYLPGHFVES